MPLSIAEWERTEIERSAMDASHVNDAALLMDGQNLSRYLSPPEDTDHGLEYAFHLLGDLTGKTLLEYGCGDGLNTVALAKRGAAKIIALDISPDLIKVAQRRLEVNGVTSRVDFVVGSAHDMQIPNETVDIVFGIAILHHLDLSLAAREVWRVLRPRGRAIFEEPVRTSETLKALRKLIPYTAPNVSPFERPLTEQELMLFARAFTSYRDRAFGLPTTSLVKLLPLVKKYERVCRRVDAALLRRFPSLSHYATTRVIELIK
jgi:2-polyprenyl-3-methyl-5-hydroxy-6-metoxy-1,4-benzoquinol methylase